ncbi:MAG: hypothetical protein JXA21_13285 [Anaerolineae bacterium]|nr:hypothetical protein [Anaerolineae bacterium]
MSTYPNYHGDLPAALNPLDLRHYFLLAYWVYFRPSALEAYLCRAQRELSDPDLAKKFSRIWRIPAYRTVFLMTPGVILLLVVLGGLPFVLGGAAWGVLDSGKCWQWAGYVPLIIATSLLIGVLGGRFGVTDRVSAAVSFGVAESLFGAVWFGTGNRYLSLVVLSMVLGTRNLFVLSFSQAAARLFRDAPEGIVALLAACWGWLRGVFYPLQLAWAWIVRYTGGAHPIEWDELLVLPLPGSWQALFVRLNEDLDAGLRILADVVSNPFQRWAVQRALLEFLHACPSPLRFLYRLLDAPEFQCYLRASTSSYQTMPIVRQAVFAELAGRNCKRDFSGVSVEGAAYRLTQSLRDRRVTPLTRFAGMLYMLLDEKAVLRHDFDLASYGGALHQLRQYPGGAEIEATFALMAAFLRYENVRELAQAATFPPFPVGADAAAAPLRPAVLAALEQLKAAGAEIAAYCAAADPAARLESLSRADAALVATGAFVLAEVGIPERDVLSNIIWQWRRMIGRAM